MCFRKSFTNLLQTFTKAKGCGKILQESGIKSFLERWILGAEKLVDNRVGVRRVCTKEKKKIQMHIQMCHFILKLTLIGKKRK